MRLDNEVNTSVCISYPCCEYHPHVQMIEIEEKIPGTLQIIFLAHMINAGGLQEPATGAMLAGVKMFECPVCGNAGIYLPVRQARSYLC